MYGLHVSVPPGVSALFSCKSGQVAYEPPELKHGLFFHFILKGLRGEAKDKSGEVCWLTLASYVKKQMESESSTYTGGPVQTPHLIGNLDAGDPLLVRLAKSPGEKDPPEKGDLFPARGK